MTEYRIGRYYEVPCCLVKGRTKRTGIWVPVMHTHLGEFSGETHHHIDLRFLTDEEIEDLDIVPGKIHACAAHPLVRMRKKCYRKQPTPSRFNDYQRQHIPILEERATGKRLDLQKLICPHQGCSLKDIKPTEVSGESCLVCPCHALAWSAKDGSLVKRDWTAENAV